MSTVPNIVLDTNCLIMAISAKNDYQPMLIYHDGEPSLRRTENLQFPKS